MKAATLLLLLLLAGNLSAVEPQRLPRTRVLSASRQFIVFADDALTASRLCARADQLRRQWGRLLGLDERWRDPIAIVVSEHNRVITQPGAGHLKYQVDCRRDAPDDVVGAMILDALCRELANRELAITPATVGGVAIPLWLPVGLREVLEGPVDELLPAVQRTLEGGRPFTLEQLQDVYTLATNQTDRLMFRANAWLLVDSLFALPGGSAKLRQLVTTLQPGVAPSWTFGLTYNGDFPDQTGREKWWSLQLVRKSAATTPAALSVAETTSELDVILRTELTQPKGPPRQVDAAELWRFTREPWFDKLLADKLSRLQLLQPRVHPFYQETMGTYVSAFRMLHDGSAARFRRLLKQAADDRAAAERYGDEVTMYLSAVEAQRGLADPLLRSSQPTPLPAGKRDPLRDYLDQFDK